MADQKRRDMLYEGNLVICDQEQQYARNLLQMFTRNRETEVRMYLFHTVEEVERFAEQKPVHTLLISREYPQNRREQIPAKERFVLVKSMQDSLAENEVGVYRYQSAQNIWRQIGNETEPMKNQKIEKPENPETEERRQRSEKRRQTSDIQKTGKKRQKADGPVNCQTQTRGALIGIYSPIHRIGKTRFALELGRELARKEPVLYLNLEEYSGGSYYFPDETGQTLADLLYYARQEKGNLGLRVSTMAGQDEELDYILPMPYVQDLQGVPAEEWLKLFEQILENCIYQKVILDLGDSVNGLFEILEACQTVYTPYIEDELARAKLNQYAENLRKTGKESVLEKTVQKKLK